MLSVVLTMAAVGLLLGFVGAGGSGFIISILTVVFGFPIQTAIGTALAAMVFSSMAGAVSHYREGNAVLKTGIAAGSIGAIGAWLGSAYASVVPAEQLIMMTAGMLVVSGLALWLRMYVAARKAASSDTLPAAGGWTFWIWTCCIGIVTGTLSGMFGIGSTPFIQLGLMSLLGMPARLAAGTTMLVIVPIALGGGAGYYDLGYMDVPLTVQVTAGVMFGSYVGAKFTRRVRPLHLQTAMVIVPITGGAILLL
ncbi:sulfite exporter TauE/SafE family protein [Paenibacillus oceani]|uniref:Probable membrane transporter protein n=1 Tax=Paenibacillus oceani TaxID=2772510 RepID=A0A927H268_9BACL|nr:sulfite exporter TauE/SafE family protein [Paenibacillus oceani]MBD2864947.1 sulfite exporter TauE/SafE family protein [Paenibacillus oceani]